MTRNPDNRVEVAIETIPHKVAAFLEQLLGIGSARQGDLGDMGDTSTCEVTAEDIVALQLAEYLWSPEALEAP